MTEEDQLRIQVETLRLRLREVENDYLQLKQRQNRWMRLWAIVSIFSCILASLIMFTSVLKEPKLSPPELTKKTPNPSPKVVIDKPETEVYKDPLEPPPLPKLGEEQMTDKLRKGTFALPSKPSASKKTVQYRVKAEDSLWIISKRFYGSHRYIEKIKRDNNLKSDNLSEGMELVIDMEKE